MYVISTCLCKAIKYQIDKTSTFVSILKGACRLMKTLWCWSCTPVDSPVRLTIIICAGIELCLELTSFMRNILKLSRKSCHSNKFSAENGTPKCPRDRRVRCEYELRFSSGTPKCPRDVREAGIIGIGVHMWRPRCTWQNREFGMLPPQKSSDWTWSSFGLNSEFYFSLKYILMVEKSPALICAWEVFQFLGQSSRNCRPLWIRWTFASNCR